MPRRCFRFPVEGLDGVRDFPRYGEGLRTRFSTVIAGQISDEVQWVCGRQGTKRHFRTRVKSPGFTD